MFGFVVAVTSFAGLVYLAATRRHPYGFRRRGLYRFLARLETTPGQEKVIRDALDELRVASRETWASARDARPELASLIRAERLDDAALTGWFEARHRTLHELEERITRAIGRIHDVLDERQKRELSAWIERGPRLGWGHHHPARCC